MSDNRKKGREHYGVSKAQRRRQLSLARETKGSASESDCLPVAVRENPASVSETVAMDVTAEPEPPEVLLRLRFYVCS